MIQFCLGGCSAEEVVQREEKNVALPELSNNSTTLSFPLGGRTFTVRRECWKVADLKLDPRNQRLGYILRTHKKGVPATDQELHKMLWDIDQVKDLYQSIYQNGGLIEDPIVYDNGVIVEGNCRTVCLRELIKKYPKDERFLHVYIRVLPADVTEEQLMLLLGELHVAGKIEWRAFDQAEYVWKMNKVFGKNYDYLASHLRWSRSKLAQKIAAYEESRNYIERTGDPQGTNRFSHFEEFMKKKELRERRESEPAFMVEFGDWVKAGKFPDARDVRSLPEILQNEEAYKKFVKTSIREAETVLYGKNPSLVSNLYSALDQAAVELENASLAEITALRDGDEPRLEKIRRLVRAIHNLEKFTGAKFDQG
jgi:hypothetical protein